MKIKKKKTQDAEGCFFVIIKKSNGSKLGESVSLRFIITQHTRDMIFISDLTNYLGCGRYFALIFFWMKFKKKITNKAYGELIVEKLSDIIEKIYSVLWRVSTSRDKAEWIWRFQKVAFLMQSKGHLTLQGGLECIRKNKIRNEYFKVMT